MRASRRNRVLVGAAAAIPAAFGIAQPAQAADAVAAPPAPEPASGDFCATTLLSPAELAAGVHSTVHCFATFDESLLSIHVDPAAVGGGRSAAGAPAGDEVAAGGSGLVAVHYDATNGRGTYMAVGGTSCEGGGISFEPGEFWNDRIRSTAPRGCSTIKHWVDPNYQGESESITGSLAANLSATLAGRVSSVRYYGPATGL